MSIPESQGHIHEYVEMNEELTEEQIGEALLSKSDRVVRQGTEDEEKVKLRKKYTVSQQAHFMQKAMKSSLLKAEAEFKAASKKFIVQAAERMGQFIDETEGLVERLDKQAQRKDKQLHEHYVDTKKAKTAPQSVARVKAYFEEVPADRETFLKWCEEKGFGNFLHL